MLIKFALRQIIFVMSKE